MSDDPLDAMKARWIHIQGSLFPWLREEVDPITEALGQLVTTLDVIGLEAFVPEPPRGPGRPPEDRRALAGAFVAKAVLGIPTTTALIERLAVDKPLRHILGWERRSQVPSEATFSRAFAEFAQGDLPERDDRCERLRRRHLRLQRQFRQRDDQGVHRLRDERGHDQYSAVVVLLSQLRHDFRRRIWRRCWRTRRRPRPRPPSTTRRAIA